MKVLLKPETVCADNIHIRDRSLFHRIVDADVDYANELVCFEYKNYDSYRFWIGENQIADRVCK